MAWLARKAAAAAAAAACVGASCECVSLPEFVAPAVAPAATALGPLCPTVAVFSAAMINTL